MFLARNLHAAGLDPGLVSAAARSQSRNIEPKEREVVGDHPDRWLHRSSKALKVISAYRPTIAYHLMDSENQQVLFVTELYQECPQQGCCDSDQTLAALPAAPSACLPRSSPFPGRPQVHSRQGIDAKPVVIIRDGRPSSLPNDVRARFRADRPLGVRGSPLGLAN